MLQRKKWTKALCKLPEYGSRHSRKVWLSKSGKSCTEEASGISEERSPEVSTGLADEFVVTMMEG
jgi:hypothetical protein